MLTHPHPLRRALKKGQHKDPNQGLCAMEMVAWLAGEAHSDEPECACPVLTSLVRCLNDRLSDTERDRILRPIVPKLVNSNAGQEVAERRAFAALSWMLQAHLGDPKVHVKTRDEARLACQNHRTQLQQEPSRTNTALVWTLLQAGSDMAATQWITGIAHHLTKASLMSFPELMDELLTVDQYEGAGATGT